MNTQTQTNPKTRIFDDPNHPHYGPVRRLHIMFMQLFGGDLEKVEARFNRTEKKSWDHALVAYLQPGPLQHTERAGQRRVANQMLSHFYVQ